MLVVETRFISHKPAYTSKDERQGPAAGLSLLERETSLCGHWNDIHPRGNNERLRQMCMRPSLVFSFVLSQADIEKMVRDAEEHAEADKKRRDLIEAKNSADSAVYG